VRTRCAFVDSCDTVVLLAVSPVQLAVVLTLLAVVVVVDVCDVVVLLAVALELLAVALVLLPVASRRLVRRRSAAARCGPDAAARSSRRRPFCDTLLLLAVALVLLAVALMPARCRRRR
jgi:uncharacterized membrane protein